jgi:UV DNA damage endonuclease
MVRLGYACISTLHEETPNRTCRLASATPERLRELAAQNLAALERLLAHNVAHDISVFRVGSELIPFGSHPVNKLRWWEELAPDFARLAAYARAHGLRLSMHPGQYTVLNSPRAEVVRAAIDELVYSARVLDALGAGGEGKIVIHLGGAYDDRRAAMTRFATEVRSLPDAVRRHLVLENDDRVYRASEVLEVAPLVGLPVVFDWFHHRCLGSDGTDTEIIQASFATWGPADGRPKTHLSSQAPGARPGSHADFVEPSDLADFLAAAPHQDFDILLEAKEKDRALLRLRDAIRTSSAPAPRRQAARRR